MERLDQSEIARRRVVEFIDLKKGRGEIWANGKVFRIEYDDLLDLTQAVEMVLLKLTGKVLNPGFRPKITSRAGLNANRLMAGDASLYDGENVAGVSAEHWYLRVEIDGNRWDNWFTRLDELVKLLYIIIREAQGDEYKPEPSIMVPA